MNAIKPKDLYHMIFYATASIICAIVVLITSYDLLTIIGSKITAAVVMWYSLFKMHKIIEAA